MKRIVITGPTASGKASLAAEVARRVGGEIVSVDSMKIYRGMDIGTAKPSAALRSELEYHFLDIVDPWEEYSVGEYVPAALERIEEIEARGRIAVLQGGTALYLNALFNGLFRGPEADWELRHELVARAESEGTAALHARLRELDPEAAEKIHEHDQRRIIRALEVVELTGETMSGLWRREALRLEPGSYVAWGIDRERPALHARIEERVERMVARGLFEETRRLLADRRGLGRTASQCIGYKQIIEGWSEGQGDAEIVARIQRDTRRLAKQQMTWFRRFPLHWLPPGEVATMAGAICEGSR